MDELQEHQVKKEKTRIKFRRVFDRKPITHIKDKVRYNRVRDKEDIIGLLEKYYEEKND